MGSTRECQQYRYEVQGWEMYAEESESLEGVENEGRKYEGLEYFSAPDLPGLIQQLMEFTGQTDRGEVCLNTCDITGRIDIEVVQDVNGETATARDVMSWRAGRKQLWTALYTFYVYRVGREAVDLTDGKGEQYYQ